MKEALKKYGKVEQCEVIGETLHVKITDGFDIKMSNTMDILGKVLKMSHNKYPIIDKFYTDKNLFHLVLKK